jgi:hypothetical protein
VGNGFDLLHLINRIKHSIVRLRCVGLPNAQFVQQQLRLPRSFGIYLVRYDNELEGVNRQSLPNNAA